MPAPLAIAVFFTIWWVSLFAVLPFVVHARGPAAREEAAAAGTDPGAPAAPRVLRTALWTTLVAVVVFAAVDAAVIWTG